MLAILALADGAVYRGRSIGIAGTAVGEIVFNTAMTGYQEILTDPSYAQQLITFTYPHIGNTGVNSVDNESTKIWANGLIVRESDNSNQHWQSQQGLRSWLQAQNLVAIEGIDTRELTRKIRDSGALNACIIAVNSEIDSASIAKSAIAQAQQFPGLVGANLTSLVSAKQRYVFNYDNTYDNTQHDIVGDANLINLIVIDYGVKYSILQCLAAYGAKLATAVKITVVPAQTTAAEILALKPDGIVLSNGPGDPAACTEIINNIKQLILAKIPLLGICLGCQLLALALGGKTYKMKFGHHGANHPIQDLTTQRVLITSQNHGFAVMLNDIEAVATHKSLFDGSLQGFRHAKLPIYAYQGHPEAGPGPHDARGLFAPFMEVVKIDAVKIKDNTLCQSVQI